MDKQEFSLVDKIPNSIDLEKTLLGTIAMDGGNYYQVKEILNSHDFVLPCHKTLFMAFTNIYENNKYFNVTIVLDYLKSNDLIDKIGGELYFRELTEGFENKNVSSFILEHCAKKIKIKSTRRKLMELFVSGIAKVKEDLPDTDNEIDKIINKITTANHQSIDIPYKTIGEMSEEYLLNKAQPYNPGISTGFKGLDEIIVGLKKQQVITIAAETSMGKTSFAWNIALNAAVEKHPVCYLSLEMSQQEMQEKAYSIFTGMSGRQLSQVNFIGQDIHVLKNIHDKLFKQLPLYFTDQTLNLLEIKRTTRLMQQKHKIELLIIDHLHFMQNKKSYETRNLEISAITGEIKALAKELNISIIMLSQLNRALASRSGEDRKPMLSDLRDSGSIEQDSDIAMFIYRPGVHNPEEIDPRHTEIIVRKNRNGKRNVSAELIFNGELSLFTESYYQDEKKYHEEQTSAVKRQQYLDRD